MSRYRRPPPSTDPVFFTVCLAEKGAPYLLEYLDVLRDAVRHVKSQRPFDVLAWVVLPDHMHAIWRLPEDDPNYSQRWGSIKARFSRDACRAGLVPPALRGGGINPTLRKGETGIWQRRFWEHHCRTEEDLNLHLRYCWQDPVRHGMCDDPFDWAPSSIHRDRRLGVTKGVWDQDIATHQFGEAA